LTKDFQNLHKDLVNEGFFEPSYGHLAYRFLELAVMLLIGLWIRDDLGLHFGLGPKLLGTVLLGIYAARCGWLMHEGGHHSLTGKPNVDRFLESLIIQKLSRIPEPHPQSRDSGMRVPHPSRNDCIHQELPNQSP
jgi:fatty acid desaturase 2 (delta-6 desaturase)